MPFRSSLRLLAPDPPTTAVTVATRGTTRRPAGLRAAQEAERRARPRPAVHRRAARRPPLPPVVGRQRDPPGTRRRPPAPPLGGAGLDPGARARTVAAGRPLEPGRPGPVGVQARPDGDALAGRGDVGRRGRHPVPPPAPRPRAQAPADGLCRGRRNPGSPRFPRFGRLRPCPGLLHRPADVRTGARGMRAGLEREVRQLDLPAAPICRCLGPDPGSCGPNSRAPPNSPQTFLPSPASNQRIAMEPVVGQQCYRALCEGPTIR